VFRYVQLIAWRLGLFRDIGWGEEFPRDPRAFEVAIRRIAQNPQVHIVGFEQELLVHQVRGMGTQVFGIELPAANEHVSALDQHPNAAGHSRIARALIPLIESLLSF
jgi:lysophospholipase L1-like esterase